MLVAEGFCPAALHVSPSAAARLHDAAESMQCQPLPFFVDMSVIHNMYHIWKLHSTPYDARTVLNDKQEGHADYVLCTASYKCELHFTDNLPDLCNILDTGTNIALCS